VGSSETVAKALTVVPTGMSSATLVTTATPVANWAATRRNRRLASVDSRFPLWPLVIAFVQSGKPCGGYL